MYVKILSPFQDKLAAKTHHRVILPPDSYYERPYVNESLKVLEISKETIRNRRILIDSDDINRGQMLLQAFTEPVLNNGFFFEFIQRWNGSVGFGKNNVKALWEGIEENGQTH